tara:strand:+ start:569 stop:1471 length:903 start_codon:yes stop_codon:yes gene_type:complete
MNHSELAHKWAHNTDTGKSQSSTNMSYYGNCLFSYGTCIAQKIEIKGNQIVLVNQTNYSVSTSKHYSHAWRAYKHLETLPVMHHVQIGSQELMPKYGSLKEFAKDQIKLLIESAQNDLTASARRRKASYAEMDIASAGKHLEHARTYARLFGTRSRIPNLVEPGEMEKYKAKALATEKRIQAKAQKEAKVKIAEWIDGKPYVSIPHSVSCVYLRRLESVPRGSNESRQIETSQGARIPYDDGKRCFEFILKMRAKGWRKNGEQFKIGMYSLDSVGQDGIVAGCHRIGWKEIERFAKAEAW